MKNKRGPDVARPWDGYRFRYIPARFEIPREVKVRILDRAWFQWRQDNLNFMLYILGLIFLVLLLVAGGYLYEQSGSPLGILGILFQASVFLLGGVGYHLLQHFRFAPCVWAELQSRGYPICACGYPTDALNGALVCPECGRAIEAKRDSSGGRA
jgi:hypothetical protein